MTTLVPASMTQEGVTAAALAAKADASSLTALSASITALQGLQLTTGTAQATTSGSSFDFTGIPSTAKRITVMINGMSNVSGVGAPLIQLGSGSIDTAGYNSAATYSVATNNVGSTAATNGMLAGTVMAASTVFNGVLVLTHMGNNIWLAHGTGDSNGLSGCYVSYGIKTLSGVLDRLRFTQHVADTFDAGSVNIMWE